MTHFSEGYAYDPAFPPVEPLDSPLETQRRETAALVLHARHSRDGRVSAPQTCQACTVAATELSAEDLDQVLWRGPGVRQ